MNSRLIVIFLLALAGSLNGSCLNSKQKVSPVMMNPTKCEKRGDEYWVFYPTGGWQKTGHVQFYAFLEGKSKRMSQSSGPDGKPIYKIGNIEVNQDSFNWAADRRKEHKKRDYCVIS